LGFRKNWPEGDSSLTDEEQRLRTIIESTAYWAQQEGYQTVRDNLLGTIVDEGQTPITQALVDLEEARNLARKMFHTLQQFPTAMDELIEDWPENPPRWLYER
jgi:hypothetical protein